MNGSFTLIPCYCKKKKKKRCSLFQATDDSVPDKTAE